MRCNKSNKQSLYKVFVAQRKKLLPSPKWQQKSLGENKSPEPGVEM